MLGLGAVVLHGHVQGVLLVVAPELGQILGLRIQKLVMADALPRLF